MTTHFAKFRALLNELFLFDQADLDFGMYRVMNARRAEISRFLDHDLLPEVRSALAALGSDKQIELGSELKVMGAQIKALGYDPATNPKFQELKGRYDAAPDLADLEGQIFSHLLTFFRRYYAEGDFLSLRRYKAGVYAIPYAGEEVKLHWANADQYYVKTGEYFRDYAWTLPSGQRVHFKLADADTERNNNKPAEGKNRRFHLTSIEPAAPESSDSTLWFSYALDPATQKQLNEAVVEQIRAAAAADPRLLALLELAPTEKQPGRTLLEKHLADYTARNTFDYFVHKDLGTFLRRELDFYIKNEVLLLDDLDHATAYGLERSLAQIKALRRVGLPIIAFLAQIEDFQKRLWLKKKFVVATEYCVTLDRVPAELFPAIAANAAQRAEWVRLFAIDAIQGDLATAAYSAPLTSQFLRENPFLVLDTRFFDAAFKAALLASFADLDAQLDGLLVHSENFQALNLLQARYHEQVKCIYIDPPYNTSEFSFTYKNNYKYSSWITMMENRVSIGKDILPSTGVIAVAIDDTETHHIRLVLDDLFNKDNRIATIAIEVNPAGQNIRPNVPSLSHDYCHVYAKSIDDAEMSLRELTDDEKKSFSEKDEKGYFLWDNLRRRGGNSRPTDRPNQCFPLFVDLSTKQVSTTFFEESQEVWPTDPQGEMRIWRVSPDGAKREIENNEISVVVKSGRIEVVKKSRMPEGRKPKTLWKDGAYSATTYGTKLLNDILHTYNFSYPKSINLVQDIIRYWATEGVILDYFAGSGTTGHAVINLNREDDGERKYILVEMGEYFASVLKPRILKVIYSADWRDGKPVGRKGSSHMLKYIQLESYEDTLNNLALQRTATQDSLLERHSDFRRDYMLHYLLDVESRASLLNLGQFARPHGYTLAIGAGSVGATKPVAVDLVETFNYLLGLRVRRRDEQGGYVVVTGTLASGERVLIIWRDLERHSNADLNDFFAERFDQTRASAYDLIYVNGDNTLENQRRAAETWKVRLIEADFIRLMFGE